MSLVQIPSLWSPSYGREGVHTYLRRARGGAFSPSDIAGLKLWLKADAIVGLNDGDPVSTWEDSSVEGNDVTQAGDARPTYWANVINGLPVVRFDHSNDDLVIAALSGGDIAQPTTMFAVFQRTGNPIAIIVDGATPAKRQVLYINASDATSLYAGSAVISGSAWGTAAFFYASAVFNGASSQLWKNGVSDASGNPGTHALSGVCIGSDRLAGGSSFFGGDIAEILLYDSALSDANRQAVESYLAAKYSL